jgi:CubicO group peptidase (beta-lactamase class C family)
VTVTQALVRPGFEPVVGLFEDLLAQRRGYGGSLCVYVDGQPCLDVWGGPAYQADSIQVLFSATKAAATICVARLVQYGLLDLDASVASIWPEFGQAGKADIPVRWLLSHRTGLPTVDKPLTFADLGNSPLLVEALEQQAPLWEPGMAHGYHPWSFGTLLGEVVRRVTGVTLGRFFASEVAGPLGLELWIGLPEELEDRVVPVRADAESMTVLPPEVALAFQNPHSLTFKTMSNGLQDLAARCNDREFRAVEIPAANGVGSARALARMYASCIGAVDGFRLLGDAVLAEFCEPQSAGLDRVTLEENRYGLGFMLPFPRIPFAGPASFGHDGAGGALAFADQDCGLSFAFLPDVFPPGGGADPNAGELVSAVLDVLR